jgi:hypothetical protein
MNPPFDISGMLAALGASPEAGSLRDFLRRSLEDPEGFARALFAFESQKRPLKSEPFVSYDFYTDLLARHQGSERPAFVAYDSVRAFVPLTYRELHLRTRELRSLWHRRGVTQGETIALVMPPGVDQLVSLFTALRMGLVICILPPLGRAFVQSRIEVLDPAHIVTEDAYVPWLGERASRRLDERSGGAEFQVISADHSRYAADATVLTCFSAFAPEPLEPTAVSAHQLMMGVLRDAILVFRATPGKGLCWPGADPLSAQPSLVLAQMLAGGYYVELGADDLLSDPGLLSRAPADVVGLSNASRDLLTSGRVAPKKWSAYCRNPAEPLDWPAWERLSRLLALQGTSGFNVLPSIAFGGSFLFSKRSTTLHFLDVLPAPGHPFTLCDIVAPEQPSYAPTGVYTPDALAAPEASAGRFLLAEAEDGYFLSGAVGGLAYGYRYPLTEAVAVLRSLSVLEHSTFVIRSAGAQLNDAQVELVGFVDPRRKETIQHKRLELEREITRLLSTELGAHAVPRRIHLFPLIPRVEGDVLDRTWVASELNAGLLARRAAHPTFVELARIRRIVAGCVPSA